MKGSYKGLTLEGKKHGSLQTLKVCHMYAGENLELFTNNVSVILKGIRRRRIGTRIHFKKL